jgi:hypothetical protein
MKKKTKTAAGIPGASWAWLDLPAVDMALRIGTAVLMCMAATLVLMHLIVYSGSLASPDQMQGQQSAACDLNGC